MPYEQYRANVQALCHELGISNPIQERSLKIATIEFMLPGDDRLTVARTNMNRAGRLFLQYHMRGTRMANGALPVLGSTLAYKEEYAQFFTPDLCEDCSPTHRQLVYGMLHCTWVNVTYKNGRRNLNYPKARQ